MKLALIFGLMLAVFGPAIAAGHKPLDLTPATVVEVWDQRVPELHTTPNTITKSNEVVALASAIQNAPGDWKRGAFTAPSGYLRFVFRRDSEMIATIGLGEHCLVRGGGGDWESNRQ